MSVVRPRSPQPTGPSFVMNIKSISIASSKHAPSAVNARLKASFEQYSVCARRTPGLRWMASIPMR